MAAIRPTRRSPEVQQDTHYGLIRTQPGTPGSRIFTTTQSSSQVVAIGQAEEIGTAQSTTALKRTALGQALETDIAQPVTAGKKITIGQAVESDSSSALGGRKTLSVGQVSTTMVAQPVTVRKTLSVGQAGETDLAQTIGVGRTIALGRVAESDIAQSLGSAHTNTIGQATESDSSSALTPKKTRAIGQASETDTATPLTHRRAATIGQAMEIGTARTTTPLKRKGIGQAVETDTAQTITRATAHFIAVGRAVEFDEATAIRAWMPFRPTATWRGPYDNDTETPLIDESYDPVLDEYVDGVVLIPLDVTDDVRVRGFRLSLHLTHTYDADLLITLIHPDGTRVVLSDGNGGSDDDYGTGMAEADRTIFDTGAATLISSDAAPFRGIFAPDGDYSVLAGKPALGTWHLEIRDRAGEDTGTFYGAKLYVRRAPVGVSAGNEQKDPSGARRGRLRVAGSTNKKITTPTEQLLVVDYRGYGGPEDRFGGFPASTLLPRFQIHLHESGLAEIHYASLFDEDYSFQASIAAGLYNQDSAFDFLMVEVDGGDGTVDDWTYGFPPTTFVNKGYRCQFPATDADYATATWAPIPYAPITDGPWTTVPEPAGGPFDPQPDFGTHNPDAYPITLPRAVDVGRGRSTTDWWIGWDGTIKAFQADPDVNIRNADYGYMPDEPDYSGSLVGVYALAAWIVTYGYNSDGSLKAFGDLSPEEQARVPDVPVRYQVIGG